MYPAELQHREKLNMLCVFYGKKSSWGKRDWQEAVHLGPHAQHGRLGLAPALLSSHMVHDSFQDGLGLSTRVRQVGGVREDIQMVRPHLLPVLQSGCGKARNGWLLQVRPCTSAHLSSNKEPSYWEGDRVTTQHR